MRRDRVVLLPESILPAGSADVGFMPEKRFPPSYFRIKRRAATTSFLFAKFVFVQGNFPLNGFDISASSNWTVHRAVASVFVYTATFHSTASIISVPASKPNHRHCTVFQLCLRTFAAKLRLVFSRDNTFAMDETHIFFHHVRLSGWIDI